ncbi:MAG: ATP-binding protein [Candidatus Sabulitectum sp.]|nr:ATP-binding protein [Candidatus Sabulitectum sp.]
MVLNRIEKLGAFYIGRKYDLDKKECSKEEVMYDARDLTTHAVCLGMTGSGKTGLCIDLLEEAALDSVPAIIIDPKGDITNLLLTFPNLLPGDFKPWVNIDDARRKELTVEEYSQQVAETWRKGLADWDQSPERIKALKNSTEFSVFTPGSDAGISISILSALTPPLLSWETDAELIREQIQGVVHALLGLIGIDADPLSSREYILLSAIIEHYWKKQESLDLPLLITSIQTPPVEKLGVFNVDTFFPAKDRFKFAIAMNSIIASPDFQSWLEGEPLNIASLLHTPSGKPRHSIIYLAHLSDSQKMFFVTLLLERVVTWMRTQSGTTSLRALLYFDEVFGFLPPVAEPPSKKPLLRLLKQARAFGLGLILTTQNPMDIDYKGMSNAGTWFIGRLQTDRDKKRLLDGLESISAESGSGFNRSEIDNIISSLDSRVFLLHNVHEDKTIVFQTRWAMSYLRGPLTRDQIRSLDQSKEITRTPASEIPQPETTAATPVSTSKVTRSASKQPVLPPGIKQVFLPVEISRGQALDKVTGHQKIDLHYEPSLMALAKVSFLNRKRNITKTDVRAFLVSPDDLGIIMEWDKAETRKLTVDDLTHNPEPDCFFKDSLPSDWTTVRSLKTITKDFSNYLYHNSVLEIPFNPTLKLNASPDESEADFIVRCREKARELRDIEVDKLRGKTRTKLQRLQTKLAKEERELEEDEDNYKGRKNEEMLSAGESIAGLLGLFGRRRTSGLSSAARRRRMTKSAKADIEESKEEIERLEESIIDLEEEVKEAAEAIAEKWEAALEDMDILDIKPRRADVQITLVTPAWLPVYLLTDKGFTTRIPAFRFRLDD